MTSPGTLDAILAHVQQARVAALDEAAEVARRFTDISGDSLYTLGQINSARTIRDEIIALKETPDAK